MHLRKTQQLARAAFTLMELLIVVAIIVVLAGVGGAILLPRLEETKVKAAKVQAKNIASACEQYAVDNGDYPQSVDALVQPDAEGNAPRMEQGAILDPWGQRYQIGAPRTQGGKPTVFTQHGGKTISSSD
jgi:general secretion pathway protein G